MEGSRSQKKSSKNYLVATPVHTRFFFNSFALAWKRTGSSRRSRGRETRHAKRVSDELGAREINIKSLAGTGTWYPYSTEIRETSARHVKDPLHITHNCLVPIAKLEPLFGFFCRLY